MEEFEWGFGAGWQHEAGARVGRHNRDSHSRKPSKGTVAIPRRACLLELGAPEATGAPRLEVVANVLPLFGGAQLAVTTLVLALHCAPGRSGAGNGKLSQGTDLPGAGGPMESLSSGGHGH